MLDRRKTLTTIDQMEAAGLVTAEELGALDAVSARYSIALSPALLDLIDPTDPADPIARQFVPSADELETVPEELADPIGDERHSPVAGIVHRYADRVLLKLTHLCPVYCRFCFRRETVGNANGKSLSKTELEDALHYIAAHPQIWEVILTGGDPLVLSPRKLGDVARRLAEIDHVKIIRWHTRMPVAKPEAVTGELIAAIKPGTKTTFVVIHANHPRELSPSTRAACARLNAAGISLLSQSVLLKGVNDDIETLERLMRALVETGVKPYYLHHADLAPGTAHFRTSIARGQELMRELRARVSGLCVPAYVLDIPGGYAKARLELCDAEKISAGDAEGVAHYAISDAEGDAHDYPPR